MEGGKFVVSESEVDYLSDYRCVAEELDSADQGLIQTKFVEKEIGAQKRIRTSPSASSFKLAAVCYHYTI